MFICFTPRGIESTFYCPDSQVYGLQPAEAESHYLYRQMARICGWFIPLLSAGPENFTVRDGRVVSMATPEYVGALAVSQLAAWVRRKAWACLRLPWFWRIGGHSITRGYWMIQRDVDCGIAPTLTPSA